jgi:WD repeat-containing protein 48
MVFHFSLLLFLLADSQLASIKLWSLANQRCLHTFMHHTESVWSLFSSHPSFQSFYSGDKSGLVCKVDVEDCSDVAEGECIVLCHDSNDRNIASSEGINKIVVMDDNLLWTASGNSSIKRWQLPKRRALRATALVFDSDTERSILPDSPVSTVRKHHSLGMEPAYVPSSPVVQPRLTGKSSFSPSVSESLTSESCIGHRDREEETTLYGIPFESLVRLTSPNDTFTPYPSIHRGRDPEVATLYSAASVMSVPRTTFPRSPMQSTFQPSPARRGSPVRSGTVASRAGGDTVNHVNSARADFEERELAADAIPLCTDPDDVIRGDHGLVRSIVLNDRIHALTVDTSGEVALWDLVRCVCLGRYPSEDVAAASHSGSVTGASSGYERDQSPREALETVRERIEGEAVVVPWSVVETKTGVLTVHLTEKCFESEIYADEVGYGSDRHFNDESRCAYMHNISTSSFPFDLSFAQ